MIVGFAPHDSLLALRPVCRELHRMANKRLFHHVTVKLQSKTLGYESKDLTTEVYQLTNTHGKRLPFSGFGTKELDFFWANSEPTSRQRRAEILGSTRVIDFDVAFPPQDDVLSLLPGLLAARSFFNLKALTNMANPLCFCEANTSLVISHFRLRNLPELVYRWDQQTPTVVFNLAPSAEPNICEDPIDFSDKQVSFHLVVILSFASTSISMCTCFTNQFEKLVTAARQMGRPNSITLVGLHDFLWSAYGSAGHSSTTKVALRDLLCERFWRTDDLEENALGTELEGLGLAISAHGIVCKTVEEYKQGLTPEQAFIQFSGNETLRPT
ncbi:hypothetical protein Q8F55_003000 [Vanrija albida]|uniref:F-box domain-containing protein n=1 Tax=Vanrija albida TaxID=181172 RepID=A0ABR3QBB4_9TREE